METPPPPSHTKGHKSSLHHKAANSAVGTIIIVILYCALVAMIGNETPLSTGGIEFAISLLFIGALPAGIFALLGIKKYGKQRLLWKGLVGILVPVILFSAALPVAIEKRKQEDMEQFVAAISKKSPRQIDNDTRLDSASITAKNEITLTYSVTNLAAHRFNKEKWDAEYTPKVRSHFTASNLSKLLKRGIKIKLLYTASDGIPIYEILITEKDLNP